MACLCRGKTTALSRDFELVRDSWAALVGPTVFRPCFSVVAADDVWVVTVILENPFFQIVYNVYIYPTCYDHWARGLFMLTSPHGRYLHWSPSFKHPTFFSKFILMNWFHSSSFTQGGKLGPMWLSKLWCNCIDVVFFGREFGASQVFFEFLLTFTITAGGRTMPYTFLKKRGSPSPSVWCFVDGKKVKFKPPPGEATVDFGLSSSGFFRSFFMLFH